MKRILAIVVLVFLSLSVSAYSSWGGDELPFVESGVLIPLGNSIYSKMDSLFVLSGYAVPSTSRPWTVAEARSALLIIKPSTLTGEVRELYDEIYSYLFVEDSNRIALTVALSPEMYLHTNSAYDREEYWGYGYAKRNHFASISLDNITHGIYGHLELSVGRGLIGNGDGENAVTIKWQGLR